MKKTSNEFSEWMLLCKHIDNTYELQIGNPQMERNISPVVEKDKIWDLQLFAKGHLAFSHVNYEFKKTKRLFQHVFLSIL